MLKSKIDGILKFLKEKVKGLNIKAIDPGKRKKLLSKLKKNYIWIILGVLITVFILTRTVGKITEVFLGKKEDEKRVA